jgi:hypothetical protein
MSPGEVSKVPSYERYTWSSLLESLCYCANSTKILAVFVIRYMAVNASTFSTIIYKKQFSQTKELGLKANCPAAPFYVRIDHSACGDKGSSSSLFRFVTARGS